MDEDKDIHLRWDHHQTNLLSVFSSLLGNENLVDCTISAEGQYVKAHRLILSACSPYFETLLSQPYDKHPIVILPDVKFEILKALMEFMYSGEVKIPQDKLHTVLELADTLQIKGLSSDGDNEVEDDLTPMRRNESSILCDQDSFNKHLSEHRSDSQVEEREDVSSLDKSEKEHSEDINPRLLAVQKCVESNSNSVSPERTAEEAAMFQDISDPDALKTFHSSSVTETLINSNTHLHTDSSILDSSQLSGSYIVKLNEESLSSENVISTNLSRAELRTSALLGVSGGRPAADLPQMKQMDQDDFDSNRIEVIILDDDNDKRDNDDRGSDGDNGNRFEGLARMIPEQSFSAQSCVNVEQCRDNYFVEPATILPNPYMCYACGRSYVHPKGLTKHLKYECGKKPKFKCPRCTWRFFHKHQLNRHVIRAHSSSKFKLL